MNYNPAYSLFQHSQRSPDRLAIASQGQERSYAEFARLVRKVAGWIGSLGKGPGCRIGILGTRSIESHAGALGAGWAGGAYVPVSLKFPQDRLLKVLELAQLDGLVVDEYGSSLLSPQVLSLFSGRVLAPAGNSGLLDLAQLPDHDGEPETMAPTDLAYIIFTSGTTGIPKGVMISCRALAAFLSVMQERYGVLPEDRLAESTDLSFDFSVGQMYMPFWAGASLHIVPPEQAQSPARFIHEQKISIWSSVPSVISFMGAVKALRAGAFPTIRASYFIGEPFSLGAARSWQQATPNGLVDNLYGPTEATVACLALRVEDNPILTPNRDIIAIGTAFSETEAAIVDESLHFLGPGQPGELALAGIQLAEGYLGDGQLTQARFPVIQGKRWYLTGDQAMRDSAGIFHHLGRIDNQVKVLGYRLELEDIEAHMRAVSGSEMVAAVAWPIKDGTAAGLVGFVTNANEDPGRIRELLKMRLPAYMVPSAVRSVNSMPVNQNGKVDRKALFLLLEKENEEGHLGKREVNA